jgi:hypothetical protein
MSNIKRQISKWLNVGQETLNNAVAQMLSLNNHINLSSVKNTHQTNRIPCKGFWVENTKDLVLYVLNGNQSKAIVVPKNGWMIRDSITIN